ncbi:MAG: hypothetical protein Q9219_001145 [cf. Caloplaca sp. 3 TL-2023]
MYEVLNFTCGACNVVDNLYSKETRFLYELIQNAEDNSYSKAIADGEDPFLAFKLYPDKIIIDSNGDGFSKSNIRAICSIARKVRIQSGPFSFAFSHTREDDDDGLGMITPHYEDAERLPRGVRTRITLTLLDTTRFEERATEFQEVQVTFLMFLSRLRQLSVELCQPGNAPMITEYSKRETRESGIYTTFLTKTSNSGEEMSTSVQKYYTVERDLQNLPFDEARKDKQGKSIDSATVILAFPVDEQDEPVITPQYTYVFLPLRCVGFQFLIQADFITQANREDVVHSTRNKAVLKGVAGAFADAMVVFCKLPSLKYRWMRYLPDSVTDEFWSTLWAMVREKLEQVPLLESWSGSGLYKPSNLEKLSEDAIAKDGSPLLPDLVGAEVYLSPKYTDGDFQVLKRLGTKKLHWSIFLDRLDADLHNPDGSKWRLMKDVDWRTRICTVLSRCLTAKSLANEKKRLNTFALIPLLDGRWRSGADRTTIYFPKTKGISIPADLGLDLACPIAVEDVAWEALLSDLGVTGCPQEHVVDLIHKRYNVTNLERFRMPYAVAHIRYLYWFFGKSQEDELRDSLVLFENGGRKPLVDTFLPFSQLKKIAAKLGVADVFPFIATSELVRDDDALEWAFTRYENGGTVESLNFYRSILESFRSVKPVPDTAFTREKISMVYYNVQLRCTDDLNVVRNTFGNPAIWAHTSNRNDSTWLSTNDCVWDGPQWLRSKQCLKSEAYLDLEHLFKVSLNLPDASQKDVVDDLNLLKGHCLKKVASKGRDTSTIQKNAQTVGPSYHATSEMENGYTNIYHSITFMEAYKGLSFEELRLQDYDRVKKPSSSITFVHKPEPFAGLADDNIIEEALNRYDHLWHQYSHQLTGENAEGRRALSFTFEASALVYIPGENIWCPPSQCVWPLTHPSPISSAIFKSTTDSATQRAAGNTSSQPGQNAVANRGENESLKRRFILFGSDTTDEGSNGNDRMAESFKSGLQKTTESSKCGVFGSSTAGLQKATESSKSSIFNSSSATPSGNAHTTTPSKSSIFAAAQPPSTTGVSFGSTSQLVGSPSLSATNRDSKASPAFTDFAKVKGSEVWKDGLSTTNSTGFGPFGGSFPSAQPTGSLFSTGSTGLGPFGNATPSIHPSSGLFGTRDSSSSGDEKMKSDKSNSQLGAAECSSPPTRVGQPGTSPLWGNAQVSKTTSTSKSAAAKGFSFQPTATSTEKRLTQNISPFAALRASPLTPASGSGINATISSSQDPFGPRKPTPTASNVFGTRLSSMDITCGLGS